MGDNRKFNIDKILGCIKMDRRRITSLAQLIAVLLGMAVFLPACVSTGNSTSGHVDAKLREHGI